MRLEGAREELKALFFGFEGRIRKLSFAIDPVQLMVATLAINLLSLALPLTAMQVYDRILAHRATDTLLVLAIGVILAATVECVLRVGRSMIVGLNGAHFEHEAAVKALSNILEAEPRSLGNAAPAVIAQDIAVVPEFLDTLSGLFAHVNVTFRKLFFRIR